MAPKHLLPFLIVLSGIGVLQAQYQIGLVPRISPDKSIYKKIGFTEIEIKYGAPAINDRQLLGELIPYDKVWRAGANNATTFSTSNDIEINGRVLSAGIYSFFLQAQKSGPWVAIFNKTAKQWGAFRYDSAEDALRIEITPEKSIFRKELTYTIEHEEYDSGSIKLNWGEIEIKLPFKLNYLNQFETQVLSKVESAPENLKWVVYIQGAEHLQKTNSRLDQALLWLSEAEKLQSNINEWNPQFYPQSYIRSHLHWTKAKIQAQTLNYQQAINSVKKMRLADSDNQYYSRKKEVENIDQLISEWKAKL